MTLHAWPLDATPAGEPGYDGRRLRTTTVAPYLAGATAARPLGVRSGVRPGTPATTVTATATTWTVQPCAGVIDPHLSASAGPYAWAVDAPVSGAIEAASQTSTRWDGLYVVIDDPAEGDGSTTPGARVQYVAGIAAAAPVLPPAPERSLRLARIVVPPTGSGAPSVVWDPPVLAAAGAPLRVRSQLEADALVSVYAPTPETPLWVERVDTEGGGQVRRHDGVGWRAVPVHKDGALPHVRMYKTTAQARSAGNWGQVAFEATSDIAGDQPWTITDTGTITFEQDGLYNIEAVVTMTGATFAVHIVRLRDTAILGQSPMGTAVSYSNHSSATRRLSAGDLVLARVYPTVALSVQADAPNRTSAMTITRLSD